MTHTQKRQVVCLHTGDKVLVCQADGSQAVRRHALNDVADKLVSVSVSKPQHFTTAAQNPAAPDHSPFQTATQSTFSEKLWHSWTDSHASHVFLVLVLVSVQYAKLATRRFLSITSDIVRCVITSCICPLIVWYNFHFRLHYTFLCCNLKAHCWLWCPLFQLLSAAATGQSGEMANCPTEFQIWDWMAVANER